MVSLRVLLFGIHWSCHNRIFFPIPSVHFRPFWQISHPKFRFFQVMLWPALTHNWEEKLGVCFKHFPIGTFEHSELWSLTTRQANFVRVALFFIFAFCSPSPPSFFVFVSVSNDNRWSLHFVSMVPHGSLLCPISYYTLVSYILRIFVSYELFP